jgi:hypothetical protein
VSTKDLVNNFLSSRALATSYKTIDFYLLALFNFFGYSITPEGINAYLNSFDLHPKTGAAKNRDFGSFEYHLLDINGKEIRL